MFVWNDTGGLLSFSVNLNSAHISPQPRQGSRRSDRWTSHVAVCWWYGQSPLFMREHSPNKRVQGFVVQCVMYFHPLATNGSTYWNRADINNRHWLQTVFPLFLEMLIHVLTSLTVCTTAQPPKLFLMCAGSTVWLKWSFFPVPSRVESPVIIRFLYTAYWAWLHTVRCWDRELAKLRLARLHPPPTHLTQAKWVDIPRFPFPAQTTIRLNMACRCTWS